MKAQHWMGVLVAVLAVALVAQGYYLFRMSRQIEGFRSELQKDRAAPRSDLYASPSRTIMGSSRPMPAQRLVTRWNDPLFGPDAGEWDPFEEMDQIQRMMNRMFRDSFSRGFPSGPRGSGGAFYEPDLDVEETADAYILRLDLPGIDKDKISVKVRNGLLTVSGERTTERSDRSEDGGYYRTERSFGSFVRSFPLPADADSAGLSAESRDGVLTIRLPKNKSAAQTETRVEVR